MKTNIIALVLAPPPCPSGLPFLRPRRTHLLHTAPSSPHTHLGCTLVRDEKGPLLVTDRSSTGHLSQPVLVATLTTTGHDANQYWLLAPPYTNSLPHTEQRLIDSCITAPSTVTIGASKPGEENALHPAKQRCDEGALHSTAKRETWLYQK